MHSLRMCACFFGTHWFFRTMNLNAYTHTCLNIIFFELETNSFESLETESESLWGPLWTFLRGPTRPSGTHFLFWPPTCQCSNNVSPQPTTPTLDEKSAPTWSCLGAPNSTPRSGDDDYQPVDFSIFIRHTTYVHSYGTLICHMPVQTGWLQVMGEWYGLAEAMIYQY